MTEKLPPAAKTVLRKLMELYFEGFQEIIDAANAGLDELPDGTNIWEVPLEVISEVGRPYTVVLTTGGPHIEVTQDGHFNPTLEGYWGGDKHTIHEDHQKTLERIIDIYIPERN